MKKVSAFITHPIFISVIGIISLSLIVWFAGPYIKFGETNSAPLESEVIRLTFILIICLLWGLNNFRQQYVSNKKNNEFIDDLENENDSLSRDFEQSDEEIKILNERFTSALSTLKKIRMKGRFNSSKAIYELPWYIIIGPPGSGKTTALINSGLEFPLAQQIGTGSLQGVGGTRNCDWWFTNDAVMIDTAGRYTTQDSHRAIDSSAWNGFLKLLKKSRTRRPINGAIIAISVQDIMLQTDEERAWHAKTIRNRIDELSSQLGIRFPVYVMLTKSDLISGFNEFFSDYSHYDRQDVCGITFPVNKAGLADFDWWSTEYDKLTETLFQSVIPKFQKERDTNRRVKIQTFPQEFSNLKRPLEAFLRQTFSSSRYHEAPLLRGIYFSSGTQDGTSIDRLMSAISKDYGIKAENISAIPGHGKSYFIGRLFKELIFSESELVGTNKKAEKLYSWGRKGGYATLVTIFISTLVAWTGSIASNQALLNDIDGYLNKYDAESRRIKTWDSDLRRILPVLNSIQSAGLIYDQDEHPFLSNLGLFDPTIDDQIDSLYKKNLEYLFQPRVLKYIETDIQNSFQQPGILYDALKTYLMLTERDHFNSVDIQQWFRQSWKSAYENKDVVQAELNDHLGNYLSGVDYPVDNDAKLISASRSILHRIPVATRVYERIKSDSELSQLINVGNYLTESAHSVFKYNNADLNHFTIPLLFTKNAYKELDFSPESPHLNAIISDDWVLDNKDAALRSLGKSQYYDDSQLEEIGTKVKELYLADYAIHWGRSLDSIKIKEFWSLENAVKNLSEISDPVYSPITRVLEVTSANTELTPYIPVEIPGAGESSVKGKLTAKAGGFINSAMEGNRVDKQFRKLNLLNRENKSLPAPVAGTLLQLNELFSYVNEILISPDPDEAAFIAAKKRFNTASSDIFRKLQIHAAGLPEPVSQWVVKLSEQSWSVILASAKRHIQKIWKQTVLSSYNNGIKSKFPVFSDAKNELGIYEFTEFFKPGGIYQTFNTQYLSPFVVKGPVWKQKVIDGRTIGLNKDILVQLERADKISKMFFTENAELPSFTFETRPVRMQKNISRFVLDMGGEKFVYSHGPKFWKRHSWPGGEEAKRVSIYFEKINNEILTTDFEGAWAWFRLLNQSRITGANNKNSYYATYSMADSEVVYELKANGTINPFSSGLLSQFRCPGVL